MESEAVTARVVPGGKMDGYTTWKYAWKNGWNKQHALRKDRFEMENAIEKEK
jgi:hypothetical protein